MPNNPFRDRLNGASGKSSNSANSLQPFAQGTIAPQINTSIRDGKWESSGGGGGGGSSSTPKFSSEDSNNLSTLATSTTYNMVGV